MRRYGANRRAASLAIALAGANPKPKPKKLFDSREIAEQAKAKGITFDEAYEEWREESKR